MNKLPYDKDLQMLIEKDLPLNLPMLRFMRHLAEAGKLEHEAAGQPGGSFVELAYPPSDESVAAA